MTLNRHKFQFHTRISHKTNTTSLPVCSVIRGWLQQFLTDICHIAGSSDTPTCLVLSCTMFLSKFQSHECLKIYEGQEGFTSLLHFYYITQDIKSLIALPLLKLVRCSKKICHLSLFDFSSNYFILVSGP